LIAFVLGIVAMVVSARYNYLFLRNWGKALYFLGIILLIAVLIFGKELNGTKGWFIISVISFQPVEFVKLALVVQFARYFGEHASRRFGWKEIIGSGLLLAFPFVLVMMQPDMGSSALLLGTLGVLLFFAGLRWAHALVLLGATTVAGILGWLFLFADYQKERIMVFINPELDPLVSGYNVAQAKIAIGSGGLFGRGLGFGSQSQLQFLPESQTDFIFSVIAEELGFIGVCLLLLACTLVLWRILRAANLAKDHFTKFLLLGIFGLFFVQYMVNIGVNLSLLPTTGIALPFVSYGGSSLLISLLLIGIVQSITVRRRPADETGLSVE
ncbi:FtsW/RodA/SpoVE family cell cycle protein, partial [Patescibacteria group bacterium]|nr:FtsW/RodA/SpoVE family cell cycle protein [Patescibacteria group bacterium]MCG2687765.1 FtsW/RodA/SpoVE family cell cycle protein [Candidatus Parcubacteria bacterium]